MVNPFQIVDISEPLYWFPAVVCVIYIERRGTFGVTILVPRGGAQPRGRNVRVLPGSYGSILNLLT